MTKRRIIDGVCLLLMPVFLVFSWLSGRYALFSLLIALFACVPVLLRYERREPAIREMMVLAVMTALAVAGRVTLALLPGVSPVTTLVVITALYIGKEAGFMTGAMVALLSNLYFGQGPWTPIQMIAWGSIGFIAGLLEGPLKRNRWLLAVFGAVSGVLYSLITDVYTVTWVDGTFTPALYLAKIITALPFTALYAGSNAVLLVLLSRPIGRKLERARNKW